MAICNNDCWNCPYEGCINIGTSDIARQNKFDNEEKKDRKPRARECIRRYNLSEKSKASKKRYQQSEKGKISRREGGRRYFQRHSEDVRAYQRAWYRENKEKKLERNRKWRQDNREKQRKPNAFREWKRRFLKRNGRLPNEFEIAEWEINYELKIKKKEGKVC